MASLTRRCLTGSLLIGAIGCGMLLGVDTDGATLGQETTPGADDASRTPIADGDTVTPPPFDCDADPPPSTATICEGRCGVFANPCGGPEFDCGFDCSSQGANYVCAASTQRCECAKVPLAIACQGVICGETSDGCGGHYECESQCGEDELCEANACVCPPAPECAADACLPTRNRCGNVRECAFCGNLQCVEILGADGGLNGSFCGCNPGSDQCGAPGDEFCCNANEACYSCPDGRYGCYDPRGNPPAGCNG